MAGETAELEATELLVNPALVAGVTPLLTELMTVAEVGLAVCVPPLADEDAVEEEALAEDAGVVVDVAGA